MNSIKLQNRMDATFTNSGNSKTSDSDRILLNISDKKYYEEVTNMFLYQILEFTIDGKI